MLTGNQIKKEIADSLGIKRNLIRVKVDTSYRVTLLNYMCDIDAVRDLMTQYEKIDRCEHTGEILSGGNTFCFVDFSSECEPDRVHRQILREQIETTCLEGCDTWECENRLRLVNENSGMLHRDIIRKLLLEPEFKNMIEFAKLT